MIRFTLRFIAWLVLLAAGVLLFLPLATPVMALYLAGVAIASPIILASMPWARRVVWRLAGEYLVSRRVGWVSVIAVALCVGMVLVVLSVMGGWLQMFRGSFKTMTGDLVVSRSSMATFAYYDEMIAEFEKVDGVEAAVPVIKTAGLLWLHNEPDPWQDYVGVVGLPDPARVDRVMQFSNSLWLQHGIAEFNEEKQPLRTPASFNLWSGLSYSAINPRDEQAARRPGMIVGGGAIGVKKSRETGKPDWPLGMETIWGRLTVVPADAATSTAARTSVPAVTTPYWIVDGSRTQTMQHDKNIYVPFEQLQKDLGLAGSEYEDIQTGKLVKEPARTTEIHIKVKPGVDPVAIRPAIEACIVRVFDAELGPIGEVNPASTGLASRGRSELRGVRVQTWQEQQSTWLNAIENEIALVTTLFSFISVVAVFLIFCIFYMIVVEKTRDIGILKSVGARAWDVAQIFLTYGAAIGFVGGALGVLWGSMIVWNINAIHTWMGKQLGIEIWNSDVYAFDKIPNVVDLKAAIVIWIIGIVAAIGGAVLPAIRAAILNPVESLRFE